MYRIHQIKLGLDESKEVIPNRIKRNLGKPDLEIEKWKIVKESIDARDKGDIKLVYSVDFSCNMSVEAALTPDLRYVCPDKSRENIKSPVIVGFGPCGIFAALILAEEGLKPIVIERGRDVDSRRKDVEKFWNEGILNPESNVQFGEGGAGTFSDGKLTTSIKDPRMRKVLKELAVAGGGEDILWKNKPHIGTDLLKVVVKNIRNKIKDNGGKILFDSKLTDVILEKGKVKEVVVNETKTIETDDLILALGHSARDTFKMLFDKGLNMEQKPFSIGVRIEHPQEMINKAQYGDSKLAEKLGPADYKLSHHCKNKRGVYTFCMCPGGEVIIASSSEGQVVTNGMSNNARNGKMANSGLLTDVRCSDYLSEDPLAGVAFQEKYEKLAFEMGGRNYKAPKTKWKNFAKSDVSKCLPKFAVDSLIEAMPFLGRRLRGFDSPDAILTGVETRSSSPVRLVRDKELMCNIEGIYPAGEGAGYAGGIVSASVDGIRAAEAVIKRTL